MNESKADLVLTDIQNGVVTKVKTAQVQLKKKVKNKLQVLIKNLGNLNEKLEQDNNATTRDLMLEAREAFQAEYNNYFRKEAEKTTYFRHMNVEKPTKWFLNLASKQKTMESPTTKLRKNGAKYTGTEEVLKDTRDFFSKIF